MNNEMNFSLIKDSEIKLHLGSNNFEIKSSNIHGIGLFSLKKFTQNTEMGPALFPDNIKSLYLKYLGDTYEKNLKLDYCQTSAVRYMNHNSDAPNIQFYKLSDQIIYARCLKDINPGDEITIDYKESFSLVDSPVPEWFLLLEMKK